MHIVSERTGSRLATASFVPAFTSQAVPDMWKQLEAMESKKGFGASESSRSAAMDPRTHGFTKKAGTGTSEPSGGGDKDNLLPTLFGDLLDLQQDAGCRHYPKRLRAN